MGLNLSDGTTGNVTGEMDKVAMVSGAYTPLPGLGVGAAVKRASTDLAETASASSLNYDFGALYAMDNGLGLGASSLNNGGAIKFEDKADPAPAAVRAGVSYKLTFHPANYLDHTSAITYCDVIFTSDWSKVSKEKGFYQSGIEMNMKMPETILLSLRAGYLFNRPEEGFTFGIGVRSGPWDSGFGFETAKDLSDRRPVSVSYQF